MRVAALIAPLAHALDKVIADGIGAPFGHCAIVHLTLLGNVGQVMAEAAEQSTVALVAQVVKANACKAHASAYKST